ncbi:MAG: recombinase RecB, partial [Nitrosomonas sp.]|nr:recombinase RecB [Nitrosomonas sp.]
MTVNKSTHGLIKPSDATSWISCIRRAWLDKHQPVESGIDGFSQLLIDSGLKHEATILAKLKNQHAVIKADSFDHTLTLMLQG